MKICAIDPGPEQSGWCMLDDEAIAAGVSDNAGLLAWVPHIVCDRFAIENVASYGMPVGEEVFATVRWTGRFQQASRDPESVLLIPRKRVLLHLCNTPRANDAAVRQRLIDLYGGKERAIGSKKAPGPLYSVKSHMWAALAVAITAKEEG
jgi:hypothetical protein